MRRAITSLLEPHLEAGHCEFVTDICDPYPIPVICEVLGAPNEDWRKFSLWAIDIFKIFNGNLTEDLPSIERASNELGAYVADMVEKRRARPRSDLLSVLIYAEEDGHRLTTEELCRSRRGSVDGRHGSTRNQLACAMALFAGTPSDGSYWRPARRRWLPERSRKRSATSEP